MNIECNQDKLKYATTLVDKISTKHSTLPVLSCILIEATDKDTLILKSTNLDMGIEIVIPVKTIKPGSVAVPSNTLNSFLNNLRGVDKVLKVESINNNLKIEGDQNSVIIKSQNIDDFPSIPKISSEINFDLDAADFVKGLKSVWYSSSVSSIKPELSTVYVYCDGDYVVFVATDSFRLAEKRMKLKKSKDFGQILIPFKNIPEIIRILESINDEVYISLDKNQISFSYKGIYLVSRVIDGVFPDYKQIIPKSISTEMIVLKQDIIDTLKISNIFSDKFSQVSLSLNPEMKKVEIKTKNNDIGENTSKIEGSITGEALDINFNYKYIIDCFQSIDADAVNFSFAGMNKPLIISPNSDTSFRYLVMPMNK